MPLPQALCCKVLLIDDHGKIMQREQGLFLSMTDCYSVTALAWQFFWFEKGGDLESGKSKVGLDRDEVR